MIKISPFYKRPFPENASFHPSSCEAKVAVIVTPVVVHNLDPHTGIPFMPHMAAHMAGALHDANFDVQVIDCFGLQPHKRQIVDEFMLLGVDEQWVSNHLTPGLDVAYIYCRTLSEFIACERLIRIIRKNHNNVKICLFENIQSVNSFSIQHVADEFLDIGCDAIIRGEPEDRAKDLTNALILGKGMNNIPGVIYRESGKTIQTNDAIFNNALDKLPLPLWEKFPLEGYWMAHFSHAPKESREFLPILTSRGCPFRCTFCISPEVNPTWRKRSAKNVVDEMEYFYRTLGVKEFHVSDLDPTVQENRTRKICEDLIERDLPIIWKLAQGTKIETIKSVETIELMARAGCRFIAFSPESGSTRLLKIMNKPFDHEHALVMAQKMKSVGISSQACLILGVPGENNDDRDLTVNYVKKLMSVGVDEIAGYIFAPVPGAVLSESLKGYSHISQCTFSPTWREDYKEVLAFRRRLYITYFSRLLLRPQYLLQRIAGIFTHRYRTKMEMSLYKQFKLILIRYMPFLFGRIVATDYLNQLKNRDIPSQRNII